MSRFRIMLSIDVAAVDYPSAHADALKLLELLRSPVVRMAVQGQGIQLVDDPVVHQPLPVGGARA